MQGANYITRGSKRNNDVLFSASSLCVLSFFPRRPFGSREMIKLRRKYCSFVYSLVRLYGWKSDFLFIALSFWMQSVAKSLHHQRIS